MTEKPLHKEAIKRDRQKKRELQAHIDELFKEIKPLYVSPFPNNPDSKRCLIRWCVVARHKDILVHVWLQDKWETYKHEYPDGWKEDVESLAQSVASHMTGVLVARRLRGEASKFFGEAQDEEV